MSSMAATMPSDTTRTVAQAVREPAAGGCSRPGGVRGPLALRDVLGGLRGHDGLLGVVSGGRVGSSIREWRRGCVAGVGGVAASGPRPAARRWASPGAAAAAVAQGGDDEDGGEGQDGQPEEARGPGRPRPRCGANRLARVPADADLEAGTAGHVPVLARAMHEAAHDGERDGDGDVDGVGGSTRPAGRRRTGFAAGSAVRRAGSGPTAGPSRTAGTPCRRCRPARGSGPPTAEPDSADRVITPARTGAQQLLAMPEKTPRAKKLAVSPRVVSGARRKRRQRHHPPGQAQGGQGEHQGAAGVVQRPRGSWRSRRRPG